MLNSDEDDDDVEWQVCCLGSWDERARGEARRAEEVADSASRHHINKAPLCIHL